MNQIKIKTPQKKERKENKEGTKRKEPMSKKTNESPNRTNHKGNIKFSNPPISNKEMGGPLKRTLSLDKPSPITIAHISKIDIT
jgi:hypothetical protein